MPAWQSSHLSGVWEIPPVDAPYLRDWMVFIILMSCIKENNHLNHRQDLQHGQTELGCCFQYAQVYFRRPLCSRKEGNNVTRCNNKNTVNYRYTLKIFQCNLFKIWKDSSMPYFLKKDQRHKCQMGFICLEKYK